MKPISIHVPEQAYQEFKSLSARTGRPVAELIRQAMAEYMHRQGQRAHSLLDIEPRGSGPVLAEWTRSELYDEMLDP